MFRYEILFLAAPEITKDESDEIKGYFSKLIRSQKGDMISFERWGKYRLAYPVNKNEYGVYFLTRFEVDGSHKNSLLASLKEAFVFKFNTIIMKNYFERLDIKASLEYRRPESLEDNPQDVDTFLKRNDMEGLIKRGPVRKYASAKENKKDSVVAEVHESDDIADIVEDVE
ncbi:30S ribosomal protein S6 [Candidatus Dependentiae bacterium]|nr:30S ribosomal protein S6 [Candidatus Dependentiae bacterium]